MNGATPLLGPVSLMLHPHTGAVATARRFVTSFLDGVLDEERRRDVELLVSEIVTNGVMHAATTMELVVCVDGGVVRVELIDSAIGAPSIRPEAGVDGGFGLRIVAGLATQWGVDQNRHGKTVWFEI